MTGQPQQQRPRTSQQIAACEAELRAAESAYFEVRERAIAIRSRLDALSGLGERPLPEEGAEYEAAMQALRAARASLIYAQQALSDAEAWIRAAEIRDV